MKLPQQKRGGKVAFSLVEVALAIGICSFALIAVLSLISINLRLNRESEQQIEAANLASMLISLRTASPTNSIPSLPNFALPASAMTNLYGNAYGGGTSLTSFVGLDGQITTPASAAYQISCRAGTNNLTGTKLAQVYLMLSWPAQMSPTNPNAGRYEIIAHIPIR